MTGLPISGLGEYVENNIFGSSNLKYSLIVRLSFEDSLIPGDTHICKKKKITIHSSLGGGGGVHGVLFIA